MGEAWGAADLARAIEAGDQKAAVELVERGACMRGRCGRSSALGRAVALGLSRVRDAMAERSRAWPELSCLDDPDEDGRSALGAALASKSHAWAARLVASGAGLGPGPDGKPMLVAAIDGECPAAALAIVERARLGSERWALDAADAQGRPPLGAALAAKERSVAMALIAAGARLDVRMGKSSLLCYAIAGGHRQAALAMIAVGGARLDGVDEEGRSPMDVAVAERERECVAALAKAAGPGLGSSARRARDSLELAIESPPGSRAGPN